MPQLWWTLGGIAAVAILGTAARGWRAPLRTRSAVLEEVRRTLRDGTLEREVGQGEVVRGRLGPLTVTVDIQNDPRRPRQSPMWRVIAEGPVALSRPVEARVAGWEGWIDPWLQLGDTLSVPGGPGPDLTLHAERAPVSDHPVVTALRRQGERLGPGALHARSGLVHVETRCGGRLEENRPLFAFLHAVAEIAELPRTQTTGAVSKGVPRYGLLEGR
ncbi:MAG TPA: hypothetical protein VJY35_09130 [Candidatus Eisenbacteria bacterium]|nr:hypothetical protein [Candidatus Eisenbacteria bacterium]